MLKFVIGENIFFLLVPRLINIHYMGKYPILLLILLKQTYFVIDPWIKPGLEVLTTWNLLLPVNNFSRTLCTYLQRDRRTSSITNKTTVKIKMQQVKWICMQGFMNSGVSNTSYNIDKTEGNWRKPILDRHINLMQDLMAP